MRRLRQTLGHNENHHINFDFFVGCGTGINREAAERLMQEASTLEREGRPVTAYRKYKLVDGLYKTNDELRSTAWAGAQRTRMVADRIAAEVTETIKKYYQENGHYPLELKDISPMLPKKAVNILNEFHLYKQADGSVIAEASLAGHSFDLHN